MASPFMSSIGDIPLVVIEAGIVLWPFSEQAWRIGQKKLPSNSSSSFHIIAEQVGHSIPLDAPGVVLEAIEMILQQKPP